MKNFLRIPLLFILFFSVANGQVVDKSINGIQTGLLGVWWNNESKLVRRWALRTEIGYAAPINDKGQFTIGSEGKFTNFYPSFQPVVSIEPRWYYNSRKRQGNSNNTFHNSGNYATIAFQYYAKFLVYSPLIDSDKISFYNNVKPNSGLFIIPTWGIRRNISYHWNYELGGGFGVDILNFIGSKSSQEHNLNYAKFIFNLHLRIGYKYGMKE